MIESALCVSPGKHEEEQEQVVSLLSKSKELNICTPNSVGGKGSHWEPAGHSSIQAPPAFQSRTMKSQGSAGCQSATAHVPQEPHCLTACLPGTNCS